MMKRKKTLSVIQRNEAILIHLKDLKVNHPFWSYRRCWAYLYYQQGLLVNKKRIYRLMKDHHLLLEKTVGIEPKEQVSAQSQEQPVLTRSGELI